MRILSTILLLCLFAIPARAGEAADQSANLGRSLKAMPWLSEAGNDIPFEIVRIETIPFLAGLPTKTEYYEIDPEVVASGYSYFYYVQGVDRDYTVGSTVNLIKLCRELAVVEELKKKHKGKEFASSVGDVFKGMGKGLANLVTHPGVSMKNMGESFRSMGRGVERAVGAEDKVGKDERGVDRSNLGDGPAGDIRRAMAYELGIDVYTDNPDLKSVLTELSQIKELGSLTSWVIPYGLSMLDYCNPMFGDEETEILIRDQSPYDLRRQVGMNLEPIFTMDRGDRSNPLGRLLLNPNYTPREIAYIGKDMRDMAGVKGLDQVLDILSRVQTPEMADLMAIELRLYAFYHKRMGKIGTFVPFRHFFASIGQDGVFRFFFYADTIRPWSHANESFDEMIRDAMAVKATGLEIWTTADIDSSLIERARQRGVTMQENIFMNQTYFPAPEQRMRK